LPDLLTHYISSYLISKTLLSPRYAAILALVGLIPDLDALIRIHRSLTHSIPLALAASAPMLVVMYLVKRRYLGIATLATVLYALHLVLDTFTSPTPILWPINTQSYSLTIRLDGMLSDSGIRLIPNIVVNTRVSDFTRRAVLEGPLITDVGVVIAIATVVALTTEYLIKRFSGRYSNGF